MAASKSSTGSRSSTSPLGDGRSGAAGNKPMKVGGIDGHRGPSPAQKLGSTRNPASVSAGGPAPRFDAPGDREGQLGTFPLGDARQHRPFKLDGESSASSDDDDREQPVGDVPALDLPVADEEP